MHHVSYWSHKGLIIDPRSVLSKEMAQRLELAGLPFSISVGFVSPSAGSQGRIFGNYYLSHNDGGLLVLFEQLY